LRPQYDKNVTENKVVEELRRMKGLVPLGNNGFIAKLEKTLTKLLQKQQLGPKLKKGDN
jgi:hypothetical protein